MSLAEVFDIIVGFLEPMYPVYMAALLVGSIPVVFRLLLILIDNIHRAVLLFSGKKKSYNDEMSIYDTGQTIDQPRQLLTGISMDELQAIAENDGEIPESAYKN